MTFEPRRPAWWGKEILSTREAADYLGYDIRTLRRWRRTGHGPRYFRPHTKTGGLRYRISDLDAFLSDGQHQPQSTPTTHEAA